MSGKKRKHEKETRKWCSVCKMWIADNRAQREQHEAGSKHKAAREALIKDIAERKKKEGEDKGGGAGGEVQTGMRSARGELLERAMKAQMALRLKAEHEAVTQEEEGLQEAGWTGSGSNVEQEELDETGFPFPLEVKFVEVQDTGEHHEEGEKEKEKEKEKEVDTDTTGMFKKRRMARSSKRKRR